MTLTLRHPTRFLTAGALVLAGCAALAMMRPTSQDPVYSVSTLRADLRRDPEAWVGRTVRVRAIAQVCEVCGGQQVRLPGTGTDAAGSLPLMLLMPAEATGGAEPLPLVIAPGSPRLEFLRHVPLLDHLVPAPQTIQWAVVAVYRVQLRVAICAAGVPPPCYATVVLDATAM
jgi:hypothetical protein